MKKITIIIIGILLGGSVANAQLINKDKVGIGFNMGAQKIYCDIPHTGFALGLEGYAKYNFSKYVSATAGLGYGELSDGTFHIDKSTFTTRMLTVDVKAAVNPLPDLAVKPIFYAGTGLLRYSNDISPDARLVGSYFAGGALEWMFQPQLGLMASLDYRFADTDNLDSGHNNLVNDGYLNIRTGITYYMSPGKAGGAKVLANGEKYDDFMQLVDGNDDTTDDELTELIEGIDKQEQASAAEGTMSEYVKLQSRVDQLKDQIDRKELELEELRSQLDSRVYRIRQLENGGTVRQVSHAVPYQMENSDFATNYEAALEKYYARDYDAAIYMFNSILDAYPNHRLSSNCQYWIGECYYGKGEFDNAMQAFNQVFAYPESVKNDDALIMMGRCNIKLGRTQNALELFNKLISDYPESEYFQAAQQYIGSI
ncbi:tol-pal system protein YbgF [candidate division KSB1 bacterium]|nr:tol-pal system protein YbgF [candidate division KSB1 bacterium]